MPVPGAVAVTKAVNVTSWPYTDGLAEATRLVVVAALLTLSDCAADVLGWKLPLPTYWAVIACAWVLGKRSEVDRVAIPWGSSVTSPPIWVVPS